MSNYCTVQVANTRFAIKCSHPTFAGWLSEKCYGFLSQEEPHLWLSLSLNSDPEAESRGVSEQVPSWLLSTKVIGDGSHGHELKLSVASSTPSDFFWVLLQRCLRLALLAKQPPDLLLHAAGIVQEGLAYLFVGPSGAGKSTVCKLSASNGACDILHDDAVALSQTEEGFRAWSTPLSGEMRTPSNISAPLRAIFSLIQDKSTYATKLNGWQSINLLACQMLPPLGCSRGEISIEPVESLKVLLKVAGSVPCYELHFRSDGKFWQCIEHLPLSEAGAGIAGKGAR